MAQFWQRLVIVIGIGVSCAYAMEDPKPGEADGRDANLEAWYKIADETIQACNPSLYAKPAYCRQRVFCLKTIGKRFFPSQTPEGQVLTFSDWNAILVETTTQEKMDIFYGGLLLIKDEMSPRAWDNYKRGQRIESTYLDDLAALSTESIDMPASQFQAPVIPMDIDEDAVFIGLMQSLHPLGVCAEGMSCYDYQKIIPTINKVLKKLGVLKFPSVNKIKAKLSQLQKTLETFVHKEELQCPTVILQAIRSQISEGKQQEFDQRLGPQTLGGTKMTNKERFDEDWNDASLEAKETINPAKEGANQAQRNDLLKKLYAIAVSAYGKCQSGQQCLAQIQKDFIALRATSKPLLRALVDYYLRSFNRLINEVVYRAELFVKKKEPKAWERYKKGPRIDAAAYSESIKSWSASGKRKEKPKTSPPINRLDILVLWIQNLVEEEKTCANRTTCSSAVQRAFQLVRPYLSEELDRLWKEMMIDAQEEWPLIIAKAILRELPSAEQEVLMSTIPLPSIKDKDSFDEEMRGVSEEGIKHENPLASASSDNSDKDEESKGSGLEQELRGMTEGFAKDMVRQVFGAIKQKVS